MADPVIEHRANVGPLEWYVVQGKYVHATCRTIGVAEAVLEAVNKDIAERKADVKEAVDEQLDTIQLNAERHMITYPNSAQAKKMLAERKQPIEQVEQPVTE